ncbi:hypothetical protein ACSHUI_00130 [Bacillus subtilis]|uniref:hypothetical protein n=1 Tax=Bacillus subtilis TaxID=1423 RepID=UPI0025CA818C|nr:hypothetical protein [Bacillus subtilis]WCS68078.1 hypothetical protein Goe26_01660 [Bacillus phage vB_BsuM-Goe26]GLI90435.1 hypothetical protein ANABIO4_37870 [Bacillus subtilis]
MRFKNLATTDGKILSDMSLMSLSDSEYAKYGTEGLKKEENFVELPEAKYKLTPGTYDLIFNDIKYIFDVEKVTGKLPYAVEITVNGYFKIRIEKIKEVTKYDFVREFVKNFKRIKEGEKVHEG